MSNEPIAIIQNLVAAKPFRPFRVEMSNGKAFNIEEAWFWQNLVKDDLIDPKEIVNIQLLNKLNFYYDYDEYERTTRAAAFDPKDYPKLLEESAEREAKRQEVFDVRGRECEDCRATKDLDIHHTYYVLDGRDPWDYPVNDFRVLCRKCHRKRHGYE